MNYKSNIWNDGLVTIVEELTYYYNIEKKSECWEREGRKGNSRAEGTVS